MGLTVFAENMGFFHKGSDGKGIGPLDVCLSPPPPPAGPVPIPYVNVAKAGDLSKGSNTVLVDGEPTALEDVSFVSTSSGDEAGTQGGSVITHKTKGKGYFLVWSRTVLVEGKGVCRHGDMMGHNCASKPPACVNAGVMTKYAASLGDKLGVPCDEPYDGKKHRPPLTSAQEARAESGPCWQCGKSKKTAKQEMEKANAKRKKKRKRPFDGDHQPSLKVAWEMGGCWDKAKFQQWATKETTIAAHCVACSLAQSRVMKNLTARAIRTAFGGTNVHGAPLRRAVDSMLHSHPGTRRVLGWARSKLVRN